MFYIDLLAIFPPLHVVSPNGQHTWWTYSFLLVCSSKIKNTKFTKWFMVLLYGVMNDCEKLKGNCHELRMHLSEVVCGNMPGFLATFRSRNLLFCL